MTYSVTIDTPSVAVVFDGMTKEDSDALVNRFKSDSWVDISYKGRDYHFRSFSVSRIIVEKDDAS